jgi:hypothetical protein
MSESKDKLRIRGVGIIEELEILKDRFYRLFQVALANRSDQLEAYLYVMYGLDPPRLGRSDDLMKKMEKLDKERKIYWKKANIILEEEGPETKELRLKVLGI